MLLVGCRPKLSAAKSSPLLYQSAFPQGTGLQKCNHSVKDVNNCSFGNLGINHKKILCSIDIFSFLLTSVLFPAPIPLLTFHHCFLYGCSQHILHCKLNLFNSLLLLLCSLPLPSYPFTLSPSPLL